MPNRKWDWFFIERYSKTIKLDELSIFNTRMLLLLECQRLNQLKSIIGTIYCEWIIKDFSGKLAEYTECVSLYCYDNTLPKYTVEVEVNSFQRHGNTFHVCKSVYCKKTTGNKSQHLQLSLTLSSAQRSSSTKTRIYKQIQKTWA